MTAKQAREWLSYCIAPWLRVRYEPQWDEALGDLAQIAYGSRDAIWTSPRVLVRTALGETFETAAHEVKEIRDEDEGWRTPTKVSDTGDLSKVYPHRSKERPA